MILDYLELFILPVVVGSSIFFIHYELSPTASYQEAKSRIIRYCAVMYIIWFIGMSVLYHLSYGVTQNQLQEACQYPVSDICLQESQNELPHITDILLLGYIGILTLFPTLLLYAILHISYRIHSKYKKSQTAKD